MRRPLVPGALLKRLQKGRALGANCHISFVDTWAWIVDYLNRAKEFFVTTLNSLVGDVKIVAGEGINVTTGDGAITISVGNGENKGDSSGSGGGSGGVSGGVYDFESFSWTDSDPDDYDEDAYSGCNEVLGEFPENALSDDPKNDGDACTELNGTDNDWGY